MTHSNKFSKRILAVALLLAAWLSVDAFNVNGIYYDFVDKTNRIVKVSYRGESPNSYKGEYIGDITIPPTVIYNGVKYFVSEIDWGAFEDCPNLSSVTIPHSVVKIGYGAFSGCSGLTSIFIPNSVKEINCYNLFENCPNLNSIEVEDWNPNYNSQNNCNAIIETSTNTLVAGCKSTIIPNSVTKIGDYAFFGCTGLTTIDIPNSVTKIGDYAFSGCTGLTNITIPQSVTEIDWSAFRECTSLTSVTIPNSVTTIYGGAFADCTNLTTINYNAKNCATYIDGGDGDPFPIFNGCVALENLKIGKNVKNIPDGLFSDFPNLSSIVVDMMNNYYDSRDNCNAIIETSTNTLIVGGINTIIPNSVKKIGNGAFSGRSRLKNIAIPSSVTEIGEGVFSYCSDLTSIVVEKGNRNYDSRNNCNAIIETSTNTLIVGSNNTKIPNSVQKIGYGAFSGRSRLKNIVIPISVKDIGDAFQGCNGLESIIVEEGNRNYDSRNNCNAIIETSTNTLMVGCNNTIIPNSVVGINEDAFRGCSGLTSITIPNSVTEIGCGVFEGCSGLTSITIPNSVIGIAEDAFRGCNGLTSVTIPSLVASIGYGAFMDCKRLTTVNFNAVNCEIWCGDDGLPGPFSGCDALKTINIGNNVKYISSCLFDGCDLTTISIPNSVTRVDCYGWDDIEKIIIPRGTRQKFKRIFPKEYHSKLVEQ